MEDAINLVENSLLSQERKNTLKVHLKEEGEDKEFYKMFQSFLEEEFDRRIAKQLEIDKKSSDGMMEIEKDYETKSAALDDEVSGLLKRVDATDFDSIDVIMDQYEKGIAILQNDRIEKAKKLFSDGAIQLIKEGF